MINKTKIEWCDYTVNPIKGICKYGCDYCYAIRLYKRFKWNPEIRLDMSTFGGIENLKAGSKIFIGSTHDLFGDWILDDWINQIILEAGRHPNIIFIFLTKNPKRYRNFMFHKNMWLGYSTTGALYHEWDTTHGDNIKFISIEPMAGELTNTSYLHNINWVIIGAETGNRKGKVKLDNQWLYDALGKLDKLNIPVFIKNNAGGVRQEYPKQADTPMIPCPHVGGSGTCDDCKIRSDQMSCEAELRHYEELLG